MVESRAYEPSQFPLAVDASQLEAEVQADNLIDDLRARLADENADWRKALFETMAEWPLANEVVGERVYAYLIGGEAFDWRALADRLLAVCDDAVPPDDWEALLVGPDPPEGFTDEEFAALLGVEKHRAHLNYLYGVTVERGLILAMEEQIRKRRVARGYSPSDDRVDEAYINLYRGTCEELLAEYRKELAEEDGRAIPAGETRLTLPESDAFTYWLFKRRFKLAEPARLASDTRKALVQLESMRDAHRKRETALRIYRSRQAKSP